MNSKERLVLLGATIFAGWGLHFGIDKGSVYAGNPTPTFTPTRTATPDAWATRIAGAQATITAAAGQLAREEELAQWQATVTAIQERLDVIHGTPTRTPTATITPTPDATAIADAKRLEALGQEQARIKATATARAIESFTPTWTAEQIEIKTRAGLITPTPTPRPQLPEIIPTAERIGVGEDNNREIPWGWVIGVPVLGGVCLASYKLYERWKNRQFKKGVGTGATASASSSTSTAHGIGRIAGATGSPSNPNTAPSTGPAQPKPPDPEWVTGQEDFERRWQAAKSKLSPVRPGDTGNEYEYILERFKTAMNTVHEMSLDNSAIQVPKMAVRIRAGMEYVIPEVWPDNSILKRFFDPRFNAGYFTSEDFAKMVYLPELYRSLSKFNKAQRDDVRRIHRILVHALHPDTSKNEADPKVQDSVDDLLKRFNPAWPYIENLIKLTP